jgi:hypothetical protein
MATSSDREPRNWLDLRRARRASGLRRFSFVFPDRELSAIADSSWPPSRLDDRDRDDIPSTMEGRLFAPPPGLKAITSEEPLPFDGPCPYPPPFCAFPNVNRHGEIGFSLLLLLFSGGGKTGDCAWYPEGSQRVALLSPPECGLGDRPSGDGLLSETVGTSRSRLFPGPKPPPLSVPVCDCRRCSESFQRPVPSSESVSVSDGAVAGSCGGLGLVVGT